MPCAQLARAHAQALALLNCYRTLASSPPCATVRELDRPWERPRARVASCVRASARATRLAPNDASPRTPPAPPGPRRPSRGSRRPRPRARTARDTRALCEDLSETSRRVALTCRPPSSLRPRARSARSRVDTLRALRPRDLSPLPPGLFADGARVRSELPIPIDLVVRTKRADGSGRSQPVVRPQRMLADPRDSSRRTGAIAHRCPLPGRRGRSDAGRGARNGLSRPGCASVACAVARAFTTSHVLVRATVVSCWCPSLSFGLPASLSTRHGHAVFRRGPCPSGTAFLRVRASRVPQGAARFRGVCRAARAPRRGSRHRRPAVLALAARREPRAPWAPGAA